MLNQNWAGPTDGEDLQDRLNFFAGSGGKDRGYLLACSYPTLA